MTTTYDIDPYIAELERATEAHKRALEETFAREADVRDETRSLTEHEAGLYLEGVEGSNEKQRAAAVFEATEKDRNALTLTEEKAQLARLEQLKTDLDLRLARSRTQLVSAFLSSEGA